ncbi:MAG: HEAT repeat domain-containing protein [Gemmata sp.]|jgi:HEAT repeat protein
MEPLSPQVMHKLVFTILVHGLPDAQTNVAYDVLAEALNNPNPQVRELAVVALAELPVPTSKRVTALSKALRDASARVRRRAARTLGDFGVQAIPAVPALTLGLRDVDMSVRRDCAGTLGRLGPAAAPAVLGLVAMLGESETRSRVVAATALKRVGRAAVPALVDGRHSVDPEVRAQCAKLLNHLAPDDADVQAALRAAAREDEHYQQMSGTDHFIPFALAIG